MNDGDIEPASAPPAIASIDLASALKLCRSIMIKGTEALGVQSILAARVFGV